MCESTNELTDWVVRPFFDYRTAKRPNPVVHFTAAIAKMKLWLGLVLRARSFWVGVCLRAA